MANLSKRIAFLIFYVIFQSSASLGQGFRQCVPGISCVPIRSCPEMVQMIRSGTSGNIRKVRQAICGFRGRQSLVCCQSSPGGMTPAPPFMIGNRDSLLPRNCGRPLTDDKILGGSPSLIGAYPWMAAMGYSEPGVDEVRFLCSGSIINSRYILTAAHCVDSRELGRKKLQVIHLGDWNLKTEEDCQVTRRGTDCAPPHIVAGYEDIITHPKYNTRGKSSDDIALIRLNINLDFEHAEAHIEPVCLPARNTNVRSLVGESRPIAAGWGLTEHGNHSNVMLHINVPLVDNKVCKDRFKEDFVGNQLCVGGEGGVDTCSGDSGGPLVISERFGPPFTQIGIVSFGAFPCGLQKYPGVYTNVADYKDWIMSNLRI